MVGGIQFDGPYILIDKDYYFNVTADGATEIVPEEGVSRKIYIVNETGWDAIALHYWGDGVTGTNWPGIAPAGTEEVDGVSYDYFELPASLDGKSISTIFNNNGAGIQFDGPYILIDKDYFFTVTAEGATAIE